MNLVRRSGSQAATRKTRGSKPVENRAEQTDGNGENKRRDRVVRQRDFFSAGCVQSVTDQYGRTDSQGTGKGEIAGFEGPSEIGLADTEHDQRDKLQEQA